MSTTHHPTQEYTAIIAICSCGYKVESRSRRGAEDQLAAHIAQATDHHPSAGNLDR